MSSTTFGQKGLEAVQNRDWAAAIPLLDKALESSNSPAWLLARAHANQQLKNYDSALQDAELAYHTAAERGSGNSRKLMIEAQYRRAIIYFRLGRFADSDCCAKWSMLLAEGRPAREDDGVEKNVDAEGRYTVTYAEGLEDKKGQPEPPNRTGVPLPGGDKKNAKTGFETEWNRAYVWRSQVLGQLEKLPADHPGRKVNVTKVPPRPEQRKTEKKEPEPPVDGSDDEEPTKIAKPEPPAPGSVPDEKLKLRADYYQTNQNVTISLFAKDLKKEDLQVQFSAHRVLISSLPREAAPYVRPGDREAGSTILLGGEIVPSGSRWSATPRKIELVLQKAVPGVKWAKWGEEKIGADAGGDDAAPTESTSTAVAPISVSQPAPPKDTDKPPAYPTSSKSGPKDWDKLAAGEGNDEQQNLDELMKHIFKTGSPDQKRAMMKSYTESNGTALSTDWGDVGNHTVETIPPEGVEVKKWNQ